MEKDFQNTTYQIPTVVNSEDVLNRFARRKTMAAIEAAIIITDEPETVNPEIRETPNELSDQIHIADTSSALPALLESVDENLLADLIDQKRDAEILALVRSGQAIVMPIETYQFMETAVGDLSVVVETMNNLIYALRGLAENKEQLAKYIDINSDSKINLEVVIEEFMDWGKAYFTSKVMNGATLGLVKPKEIPMPPILKMFMSIIDTKVFDKTDPKRYVEAFQRYNVNLEPLNALRDLFVKT